VDSTRGSATFGMRLIVLPPNSPKLNGHIESLNATLVRKLLNFKGTSNDIKAGRANPKQFISDYQAARPHKILGLKTPQRMDETRSMRKPPESDMWWGTSLVESERTSAILCIGCPLISHQIHFSILIRVIITGVFHSFCAGNN